MKAREGVLDIETEEGLTVARFLWPGNRAASGLWFIDLLDRFFDEQHEVPSKVVVFVAPPETVRAENLELCDRVEDAVSELGLKHRMARRENMLRRLITAIRETEPLVIGVVDGTVALRAVAPLLACDLRIAGEGATFQYDSKEHPVAPAGGALWFLNRLVGPARTAEIFIEERPISAPEAKRLGLVNFVVSADAVESEAIDYARRLAALPKATLRQLKNGLVNACEDLNTYFDRESQLLAQVTSSMFRLRTR